jgi:hypothetical protein
MVYELGYSLQGGDVMTKTEWYPPEIKPVHVGVYEAFMKVIEDRFGSYCFESGFAYWNGKSWGAMHTTAAEASKLIPWTTGAQRKAWRGLTEPAA